MAPLIFLHLPKSGGSSLRELFRLAVPAERRLSIYGGQLRLSGPDQAFVAAHRPEARKLDLIYGHISFGVHRFLNVEPRYAMFLRDPVQRVLSLYRDVERNADSPFHEAVRDGLTIEEWVSSGATETTNNHACRMLAGVVPEPGRQIDDPSLLEAALETIDRHIELLGVMERFPVDSARLCTLLGLAPAELPHVNRNPAPAPPLPEGVEKVVRDHNRLDLELYRLAIESLNAR